MSSSLATRFTARYEPMPRMAALLGKEVIPATRYIEYDPIDHSGRIWYAVLDKEVRCIHDPVIIVGHAELAQRLLALLRTETFNPGWPDDLKTCEETGRCSWTAQQEVLNAG